MKTFKANLKGLRVKSNQTAIKLGGGVKEIGINNMMEKCNENLIQVP